MKFSLKAKAYKLQLALPFTTSRYTVTTQDTVIVSISNGEFTGYGEATANPFYGSTVEKILNAINLVKSIVEDTSLFKPEQLWNTIEPYLVDDYFTLCAIDCAYWDLYAKINKRTLRSFWSSSEQQLPKTNYTIGLDSISKMKQKIIETPWPIYKIKLGTSEDVQIMSSIRAITNATLRIDANCAWTFQETIDRAIALKKLGVEFIEQPLKVDQWNAMQKLKQKCVLPLIADESCQRLADVEKCIDRFHGINIKLMKCGGLTPALKMIALARMHGLSVMAGCMTESTIGISNLVQLAPLLDDIDADGALLLKEDIATGVTFSDGSILFSNGNGSGTELI